MPRAFHHCAHRPETLSAAVAVSSISFNVARFADQVADYLREGQR